MNIKSMLCGAIAAAALGTDAIAADEANLAPSKPASGSDGIISTEGARPWESVTPFDVKFVFDWAKTPVTRPDGGTLIENRNAGWFVADLHVLDPISLSVSIPYTLHERGTPTLQPGPKTPISPNLTGLGDIRITPRIGLLREETSGMGLAIQATIELPSSDKGLLTTWGEPVAEGLVAIGRTFGTIEPGTGLKVLGNIYGFTAPNRQLQTTPLGAGFGLRAGAEYETGRKNFMPSRAFAEVDAKFMPRQGFDEHNNPSEWRLGVSWCFGPGITADFAAGAGINQDPGAPSFRLITSVGFGTNVCSLAASKKAAAAKAATDKAAADKVAADKAAADKVAS